MAKAKDVFMSKKVGYINKNRQPSFAIAINCFLAYFMATFINNEKELIAIANLGVTCSFIIALSALIFILYKKKEYIKIIIPLVGYGSCLVIGYYSLSSIGKLTNVIPFFAFILLGIILFIGEKIKTRFT